MERFRTRLAGRAEAAGTWLCPNPADRARAVDMDARLKPMRRLALIVLAIALVLSAPSLGLWTLIPLALATLGFVAADRGTDRVARPELLIAVAWMLSQLAIGGAVALGGGPENPAVAWLAIPVVTLPARFRGRAVAAGVGFSAVVMLAVTAGVDLQAVLDKPEHVVMPLALLIAVALLSVALMRSDVEHRAVAAVDPLTGLLNRSALELRAAELGQQSQVLGLPVAVIVGDLDRFKRVNDEHGHAVGDAVLRATADRLRAELRAYDLVYRVGGEEFVVLLPGADAGEAARMAERLRRAIASVPAAGLAVTMSFGVSASLPGGFGYREVFADADAALYAAKSAGRDTVRAHDAAVEPLAA